MLSRQDCGPTRSNSRHTEVAQEALRTRMLLGLFQGGRQARLHALPVNAQLAPGREGESDGIEFAGQPGTIQIPLDERLLAEPTVRAAVKRCESGFRVYSPQAWQSCDSFV